MRSMMTAMKGKTVAERADANGGYLTSSNRHPANRNMESATAEKEADGPPNLRDATDEAGSCARCSYYGKRRCEAHDCDVMPGQICDDFSMEDGEPAEGESDDD